MLKEIVTNEQTDRLQIARKQSNQQTGIGLLYWREKVEYKSDF